MPCWSLSYCPKFSGSKICLVHVGWYIAFSRKWAKLLYRLYIHSNNNNHIGFKPCLLSHLFHWWQLNSRPLDQPVTVQNPRTQRCSVWIFTELWEILAEVFHNSSRCLERGCDCFLPNCYLHGHLKVYRDDVVLLGNLRITQNMWCCRSCQFTQQCKCCRWATVSWTG